MFARISNLAKTESEWSVHPDLVLNSGELAVFLPDQKFNFARLKIGDGKTSLKDLDFFIDTTIENALKKYKTTEIIDCGRITDYENI